MANPPPSDPSPGTPPVSAFGGDIRLFQQHPAIKPPHCPGIVGALDNYELLSVIGQGGMGLVFKARDTATDRIVAVKLLRTELAGNAQAQHRFAREARHMSQLRHPNILEVLAVGTRQDVPYFVIPFVERGSLATILRPDTPLERDACLRIAIGIAQALQYAHAKGITHRDLKPGNVLLDPGDTPQLTDFGLARTLFNDSLTDLTQPQLEGTAAYMSPQLARLEAEDTRCDIYAFGALLYEMLTGRVPYEGESNTIILEKIKRGPPTPIAQLRPDASADLTRVAETAMAREHRDRYASMSDVLADLERIQQDRKPLGTQTRSRATRWPVLRPVLAGATCIVLAAVVLTSWLVRDIFRPHLELVRSIKLPEGTSHVLSGDWDDDREPDLLFVNEHEQRLGAISYEGNPLKLSKFSKARTSEFSLSLVTDIDGDGIDEAFLSWANGTDVRMVALNLNGSLVREFATEGTINVHEKWGTNYSRLVAWQVVDLDGDNHKELLASVVSTWAKRPRGVVCYDLETGTNKWFYETAPLVTKIEARDLDHDGKLEVVVSSNSSSNGNSQPDGTDDQHAYLYVISHDGNRVWHKELCDYFATAEAVSGPGIQGTSNRVLVWVTSLAQYHRASTNPETGRILAFDAKGNTNLIYDAGLQLMSCIAADLDDDGTPEVLCTDRNGYVHVLNADLSPRSKKLLTTNQYDYVDLRLVGVIKLGMNKQKNVVLTTGQVEFRSKPWIGNDPRKLDLVSSYDHALLITDVSLNLVAKHVVAKKWTQSLAMSASILDVPDNSAAQIMLRADHVYFFRLKPGLW